MIHTIVMQTKEDYINKLGDNALIITHDKLYNYMKTNSNYKLLYKEKINKKSKLNYKIYVKKEL